MRRAVPPSRWLSVQSSTWDRISPKLRFARVPNRSERADVTAPVPERRAPTEQRV